MQAGFIVCNLGNQAEFRTIGPASPLVTCDVAGPVAVVVMGRLYHTADLLGESDALASDASRALAVYQRCGTSGLARLEGDFALVLWDAKGQHLFVRRDPLGGYPLFQLHQGDELILSTSLRVLMARLGQRTLDEEYLAEYLMLPGWTMPELKSGRCVYTGVERVPAGQLIEHPGGPQAEWDWCEGLAAPATQQLPELAEQFRDLLQRSIRARMRGTTAAHLSGGMDSTSVALLARQEAKQPLHTLSLIYDQLPGLSRETPFVEKGLGDAGNLVVHRIPADDVLDFDRFVDPPSHEEPCPWLWRMTMETALVEAGAVAGVETILTGHGADNVLDMFPWRISRLLRRGRVLAAWAEAGRWARAANCSAWKYFLPYGLAPLLPASLRIGLGTMLRGGYASWQRQTSYTIAPWVRPDFARRLDLRGRALANLRRREGSSGPAGAAAMIESLGDIFNDHARWSLAAPRGIHLAHPFLDSRLIRFCLAVQAHVRLDPGQAKPLLAEAMRGILPEEIRTRRRKGHFNEVYFRGLARNLPLLERLVHNLPSELEPVIDSKVLLDCLRRAAMGGASALPALDRLNGTLSLLRWLQQEGEVWRAGSTCLPEPGQPFSSYTAMPLCPTA
jgi:asparagine synthase (glutamine-hydrolysing)